MTDTATQNDKSEKSYSITQLCREFGVTPRTLRFYEQRMLLTPLRRGSTRVFTHRDYVRLQLILRGKSYGFTLTEIGQMLDLYDKPDGKMKQLHFVLPKLQSQLGILRKEHQELDKVVDEISKTCTEFADKIEQMTAQSRDD